MTTPPSNPDKLWETARVAAFWGYPNLTYDKWRTTLLSGAGAYHEELLKQSLLYMPCKSFILLAGKDVFIERYPGWRAKVFEVVPTETRSSSVGSVKSPNPAQPQSARACLKNGALDAIWSALTLDSIYAGQRRLAELTACPRPLTPSPG